MNAFIRNGLVALLSVLCIAETGYLLWPRPMHWAARNACGGYCVHVQCPRGFHVIWTTPESTDTLQWSIDAYNDYFTAKCRLN